MTGVGSDETVITASGSRSRSAISSNCLVAQGPRDVIARHVPVARPEPDERQDLAGQGIASRCRPRRC